MEEFSFPSIAPNQTLNNPNLSSIWLLSPLNSTHFRRSFSSTDCASLSLSPNNLPKRDVSVPASPALSDFGTENPKYYVFDDKFEGEERMDCLWEKFHNFEVFIGSNFDDGDKKISRRRSVGYKLEQMARKDDIDASRSVRDGIAASRSVRDGIVASRSVRHGRKPNLVVMLRVLKKWFVNQGSKDLKRRY